MIFLYCLLTCLLWTTNNYCAAPQKKLHFKRSSVQLHPLEGTMHLGNDAISALELHICGTSASAEERTTLYVPIQVSMTIPFKKIFTEYIPLASLESGEELIIEKPITGNKSSLISLKPSTSFAYDLALIKARQQGLRTIEWEGAKHESSRCRRALNTLKEEFPLLADYCDQLHENTFKRIESASPYTSAASAASSTTVTQQSNAPKKPLPLIEKCIIAALAHAVSKK